MRRYLRLAALPLAFAAGLVVSHLTTTAHAQPSNAPLQPQIIDISAYTDADIGSVIPNMGTLRTKTLVVTPNGTVSVQSGNVPKHTHQTADEIQYIISGTGTFWLGNEQREIHPGDLIVVPKGTVHAGAVATSGEFKAIVIKLPPQALGDTQLVD